MNLIILRGIILLNLVIIRAGLYCKAIEACYILTPYDINIA